MGAFFAKIRALFCNSRKKAGETPPPPHSSYAPCARVFLRTPFLQSTSEQLLMANGIFETLQGYGHSPNY